MVVVAELDDVLRDPMSVSCVGFKSRARNQPYLQLWRPQRDVSVVFIRRLGT
jgi:hypothetical protein